MSIGFCRAEANHHSFIDLPILAESLTDDGKKVHQDFQIRYGPSPSGDGIFSQAYEGFRARHAAIQSNQEVSEFLKKTEFSGIAGKWHFGGDGFWVGPKMVMKKIENQKIVSIAPLD